MKKANNAINNIIDTVDNEIKLEEKAANKRKARKRRKIIIAASVVCFVIAAFLLLSVLKVNKAEMLISDIGIVDLDSKESIEKAEKTVSSFIFKWQFDNVNNINLLKEKRDEYDALVNQNIDAISSAIESLASKQVKYTSSFEKELQAVRKKYNDAVPDVQAGIDNYETLKSVEDQFDARKERCKHSCDRYISCSYCGGKGRLPVKFYSQGDWGEVSYSSYDCPKCSGKGHFTCSKCNGYGYYYTYEG